MLILNNKTNKVALLFLACVDSDFDSGPQNNFCRHFGSK